MKLWEVLKAIEEGDKVEYFNKYENKWEEFYFGAWHIQDAEKLQFRIKPKPMEIWVNFYENQAGLAHSSKQSAIDICNSVATRVAVHFREVIGDE